MNDTTNYLALPDEELIEQSALPVQEQTEEPDPEEPIEEIPEDGSGDPNLDPDEAPESESEGEGEVDPHVPSIKPKGEPVEAPGNVTEDGEEKASVDYEEFYKRLTTPFRANGKSIQTRSAEEIIKLMQLGANYTQKMQQMAPHRKIVETLKKNNLLDEGKINWLIDLSKNHKGAIGKLLKEGSIDPMDVDLDDEEVKGYTPESHQVSDNEIQFNETLEEIKGLPNGLELLRMVHTDWDNQSKDILWQQPATFHVLYEQKQSGLYDYVVSEIERAKMLGKVAPNAPFISVYRDASEDLYKQGKLNRFLNPENQYNPKPVAKTVQKKPSVGNHQKASAASTGYTSKKTTGTAVPNPLSMSDDDFLKLMSQQV